MHMRWKQVSLLGALCALGLGGPARAAEPKSGEAEATKGASAKKPTFESSTTTTATATVESVDMKKRTVTFHTPEGELETVDVGDRVKNLAQVKPGDLLTVTYREFSRVKVYPHGAAIPETGTGSAEAAAPQGEKPAGGEAEHTVMAATVEKLDKKTGEVTLKGEKGKTWTMHARNKKNLENVEVGDQVVLTHERAVAASVEKPKSGD
jgi:Cu/Ag efflux protein CusF